MEYRTIGYVAGTHGVKGEIKVKLHTDFVEERFGKGKTVYLDQHGEMIPYTVENKRMHKGMLLVKFLEVHQLNEIEDWRSLRLCVGEDQLHDLAEDEIYVHDLLGMRVESVDHEDLGEVAELLNGGAHLILRVKKERELLIPYVKAFVKSVDIEEKKLIVELLEGMR